MCKKISILFFVCAFLCTSGAFAATTITGGTTTVKIGIDIRGETFDLDGGNLKLTGTLIQKDLWNQYIIGENLNGLWNNLGVASGARANSALDTIYANSGANGNQYFRYSGLTDTFSNSALNAVYPNNANTTYLWTGFFTAGLDDYDVWCQIDDSYTFWIDKNQDGYFGDDERVFAVEYGSFGNHERTMDFQLTPGETYAFAMTYVAAGGGNYIYTQMGQRGTLDGSRTDTGNHIGSSNGANNGGEWYASLDSDFSGTTINVNQDGAVDFLMQKNILGAMNLNGSRAAITLGNMGTADVNQLSVSGDSGLDVSAGGKVNLKNISFGAGAKLTKYGAGTMGIGDQTPGTKFTVKEGTLRAENAAKLDGTSFTLDGGKLSLGPTGMTDEGKLRLYTSGTSVTGSVRGGDLSYGAGALADGTRSTFLSTAFSGDGELTSDLIQGHHGDFISKLWAGYFIPEAAQMDLWRYADDGATLWIDLNQDGVYQVAEQIFRCYYTDAGTKIELPDLVPGQAYGIMIAYSADGPGNSFNLQMAPRGTMPDGGDAAYSIFADNGATWGAGLVSDYRGTNINVTADSELELRSHQNTLGNISLNNNSTLNFTGVILKSAEIGGLSGSGTLKAADSVTLVLGEDSVWTVNLRGEDDYDKIFVDGASLALDGMTLDVHVGEGFQLTSDMVFELMSFGDIDAQLDLAGVNFAGSFLDFSDAFLHIDSANNLLLLGGLKSLDDAGVPEPATWVMMLAGMLGLAVWRKRR